MEYSWLYFIYKKYGSRKKILKGDKLELNGDNPVAQDGEESITMEIFDSISTEDAKMHYRFVTNYVFTENQFDHFSLSVSQGCVFKIEATKNAIREAFINTIDYHKKVKNPTMKYLNYIFNCNHVLHDTFNKNVKKE